MIQRAICTISLDLELLWGRVLSPHHNMVKRLRGDTSHGRRAVSTLLELFEKHNIPATWATVGHLFLDHCERESCIAQKNLLHSNNKIPDPHTSVEKAPLFYGKDIVEAILSSSVKHEIGLHSFCHVPFSQCSREVAEAEVSEGIKLAEKLGITLKSFVFPKNDIGHVDVLKQYGFKVYRGPNLAGKGLGRSLPIRTLNFAGSKVVAPVVEPIWRDGIWEIPSSMMFSDPLFAFTLLFRAKAGLLKAIRDNKVFHVFLHPEDLLAAPSLSNKLDRFLAFVSQKRGEGKLQVMTMGELSMLTPDRKEGLTR